MLPVFSRIPVKTQQHLAVFFQTLRRLWIFRPIRLNENVKIIFCLLDARCHPNVMQVLFGFALQAFRQFFSTFAVLCTQQRCRWVSGYICSRAFQNPNAPSPIANRGLSVNPRCLRSRSTDSHDSSLSRNPSSMATSSFLPASVTPIITSKQCFSAIRTLQYRPSAQKYM